MIKRLDIISHVNTPMRINHVPKGEQCPNHVNNIAAEDLIEFYDSRYPHTPDGQYISAYFLTIFMKSPQNSGLDLCGSIPEWKIDARTKLFIMDWIYYLESYPK